MTLQLICITVIYHKKLPAHCFKNWKNLYERVADFKSKVNINEECSNKIFLLNHCYFKTEKEIEDMKFELGKKLGKPPPKKDDEQNRGTPS